MVLQLHGVDLSGEPLQFVVSSLPATGALYPCVAEADPPPPTPPPPTSPTPPTLAANSSSAASTAATSPTAPERRGLIGHAAPHARGTGELPELLPELGACCVASRCLTEPLTPSAQLSRAADGRLHRGLPVQVRW